ncbi:MAG: hypothetical protein DRI61_16610 [Chloroflexi bacterium]|nr:MAG: hypothetical protein DRI61_16610 [Chloroflexota bacterium]
MDVSKKYIKMCEKAKEIQEMWLPQIGDYYVAKWNKRKLILCGLKILKDIRKNKDDYIWLPRQDQLQDILIDENYTEYENPLNLNRTMMDEVSEYVDKSPFWAGYKYKPYYHGFDTLEQLWLAFLMYKKYGKIWNENKGEWVNE